MAGEAATLADILQVEEIGTDVYRAWTPPGSGRSDIFGGQVAGQGLRAALHTVDPSHLPNSIHGYFLRRGRPDLPLDIHVERIRAGRTYTSRRIDVSQEGKTIFAMLASFHLEEPGREFDHAMPEGVPGPDDLEQGAEDLHWHPQLEVRAVPAQGPVVRWWGRVPHAFPADPALHFCGLLYASDLRAGGAAMAAVGYSDAFDREPDDQTSPPGNFGSLDHSVWFHRVPDVGEWFYCDVHPLTVRDSRGLVLGTLFDREGRHLASFTQEMFLKAGERPGARRLD